jgi:hypothetical protein
MRAPTWDGPTSDAAAMSFGFSGRFWPISRPLFQGARRQRGKGFSVVIVVPDAGPVHLSAGSPSTGCDNLPGKDAIVSRSYFTRLVRLSYLAPDITQAILDGRQPPEREKS